MTRMLESRHYYNDLYTLNFPKMHTLRHREWS